MRIAITGASGLIGQALVPFLRKKGHEVMPLVRTTEPLGDQVVRWEPEKGFIDYKDLENVEVFINLAGENIGSGRWTKEKKAKILNSRIHATNFLAQVAASLEKKPFVFINASAVGYYGSQGDILLTEDSPKGEGFLSDVCQAWERATDSARRKGIRVCLMRFGMVLSDKGGALKSMIAPFKLGLGGRIGRGSQWWSWISLEDLCRVILHTMDTTDLEGPINTVSPFPVTNQEFTAILAEKLHRPAFLPFPAPIARLVFGEMANELMLSSQRVLPNKLIQSQFKFKTPLLKEALEIIG